MPSYVGLLRGINVGGRSIVRMAELRDGVAAAGLEDVRAYIASGNVLFRSTERSGATLDALLERAIAGRFGLPVRVVVRSAAELARIVERVTDGVLGISATMGVARPVESPPAISLSTSSSRSLKEAAASGVPAVGGGSSQKSSIRRRVIAGASSASPAPTVQIAATNCSRVASLSRKRLTPAFVAR